MSISILFLLFLIFFILYFGIKIVPQSQNYIVERLGKYHKTLAAGLHIIVPFLDTIRHKIDILERQLPVDSISTITLDNVKIGIHLAILYRINDASKSVYRIKDIDAGIKTIVIGVVRDVIGKTNFDDVQSNREKLSDAISKELKNVTEEWGIIVSRVEILDVVIDEMTLNSMQLQLSAERQRRAAVMEAEGEKKAKELQADAEFYSAKKLAEAKKELADAEAYAVSVVAKAIKSGGDAAILFETKKIEAEALKNIGNQASSKIVLIPSDLLETFQNIKKTFTDKK